MRNRPAFGLVCIQQRLISPTANNSAQLEAKVQRIAKSGEQTRPTRTQMNMCRITGKKHAPFAIGIGQPAGVGETRKPPRLRQRNVHAIRPTATLAQLVQRHGRRPVESLHQWLVGDHPQIAVAKRNEKARHWRAFRKFDIAQTKQRGRFGRREADAGQIADRTVRAIAPDHIAGAYLLARRHTQSHLIG